MQFLASIPSRCVYLVHSVRWLSPLTISVPDRVASLVKTFLNDIQFVPTGINPVNEALEDHLSNLMYTRGIECKQLTRTIRLACVLVEASENSDEMRANYNIMIIL